MGSEAPYPIKKYILLIVVSVTIGFIISVIMAILLGLGFQGTIIIVFICFPSFLFLSLYGFYRWLVINHGLKGDKNLFWGGKW